MRTFILLFCLLASAGLAGQNTLGLPEIINYSKQVYNAGTQNWDIRQDATGFVYFANNDGLLTFDGTFWHLYPLPNRTIVRAIDIGQDGRIYTGGQNELGYFAAGVNGRLQFHSLLNLIPQQDRSFDDVWNICRLGSSVFFRTNKRIFHYSHGTMTVYRTATEWRFMGCSNGRLLAQDQQRGLLLYQLGAWRPFGQSTILPASALVTSYIPIGGDSSLLTTLKDGIFISHTGGLVPVASAALLQLAPKHIYKAVPAGSNRIALATSFAGCHVVDHQGNLVQSLTEEEGLQTNNIRSIFPDRDKNLWIGLDNGIDFVAFNNAIKHIYPRKQNIGSGYSARFFNNQLYLGTSNGLYRVAVGDGADLIYARKELEPVPQAQGQIWNLSVVNNTLLTGHHEGAFVVEGNRARPLDNRTGFWTFLPVSNLTPSPAMVAGSYNGLHFFEARGGSFFPLPIEAGFESARFVVVEDEQTFWVAHPYKGIFRVQVTDGKTANIKKYNQGRGLISANNNYLYKVKNKIVAATENGIYEYNQQKDRFEPSAFFQPFINKTSVRYLKEDPSGNVWFVRQKELGVVDFSSPTPKIIHFPELISKMVSGFESIYPLDDRNIFIGAEKGFYHVDFAAYKRRIYQMKTQLRLVSAFGTGDSTFYGGYGEPAKPNIPYGLNSLHFEYSATLFGQQPNLLYSFYLAGFDQQWSEWLAKTEKDYTNLPPGDYTFQVKARNNLGNESEIFSYQFTILPPWYKTRIAYGLYLALFLVLIYMINYRLQKKFLRQQKKYEAEQAQLRYLHQLELEKNEKELVKLRNEKLEAELAFKNTELASSAMHLVQKGELLSKIKEELVRLNSTPQQQGAPEEVQRIIKILREEDRMDADWEQFAQHFDNVHSNFLTVLKKKFPNLTPNELKLCAYLRMNLSTKEIAQLMNITVRGVEISRYRLRKKLALPTSTSLFDFLMQTESITNGEKPAAKNDPAIDSRHTESLPRP